MRLNNSPLLRQRPSASLLKKQKPNGSSLFKPNNSASRLNKQKLNAL